MLGKTRATLYAAAILIILTAALCVLATLTGWVFDRRKDFAIMKALGASESLISGFFAAEAASLGAVGAALGFIIGIGIAAWIGRANFNAPVVPRFSVFPVVLAGQRGGGAAVSHCPHVAAATRATRYHLEGRVRVIKLKQVSRLYPAKAEENGGSIRALDDFSLTVDPGEWVSIMGPSGSGKSTLVNLIGCLDRPSSGEIWLDGQDVANISAADLNRVRAEKIGFVFQQFHLIPYLTALENVMLAQYFHSMTDEKEALDALERVGLKDRCHHVPSQLSGGEQQRVCIARALINDPKIILADEPTGNLDAQNEEIVLRLLREFHQQGRTIVMVTHDPVVARLADRRIELHHGKIAAQEVFAMADEEQFDEILEELWVVEEHGQIAELEHMDVHGALPVSIAVEKMTELGLLDHDSASARIARPQALCESLP